MEHRNRWKELESQKVCGIDLDGVLVDYPKCWIDFFNKKYNYQFSNLTDMKQGVPYYEYKQAKKEYRKSGVKAKVPAMPYASEFTQYLKMAGYDIVILTARDVNWENRNVARDTYEWLKRNKIEYDSIIFDKFKHIRIIEQCPNLKFFVEDNHQIANLIGKFGYRVYVLDNMYNRHELLPSVVRVKTLNQILMCEGIIDG